VPSDPLLKIDDDVGHLSAIAVQCENNPWRGRNRVPIIVGVKEIRGNGRRRQNKAAGSGCYATKYDRESTNAQAPDTYARAFGHLPTCGRERFQIT
jgi:hypothetical protein